MIRKGPGAMMADIRTSRMKDVFGARDWAQQQGGVLRRAYRDYQEYLDHQKSKLDLILLKDSKAKVEDRVDAFRANLESRLRTLTCIAPGKSVLCLAARLGGECRAFINLGCFAVGIDLNPGEGNRHVVHGDFHDIQFAAGSVDIVYCNSLDHSFDISRMVAEVHRVLKPGGRFIAEIFGGTAEEKGRNFGLYEATWWENAQAIVTLIEAAGFDAGQREKTLDEKNGVALDTVVFVKKKKDA